MELMIIIMSLNCEAVVSVTHAQDGHLLRLE